MYFFPIHYFHSRSNYLNKLEWMILHYVLVLKFTVGIRIFILNHVMTLTFLDGTK